MSKMSVWIGWHKEWHYEQVCKRLAKDTDRTFEDVNDEVMELLKDDYYLADNIWCRYADEVITYEDIFEKVIPAFQVVDKIKNPSYRPVDYSSLSFPDDEKGSYESLFEDENFQVVVPQDFQSSYYFGYNTLWEECRISENNRLHKFFPIIIDKERGRKYKLDEEKYLVDAENNAVPIKESSDVIERCAHLTNHYGFERISEDTFKILKKTFYLQEAFYEVTEHFNDQKLAEQRLYRYGEDDPYEIHRYLRDGSSDYSCFAKDGKLHHTDHAAYIREGKVFQYYLEGDRYNFEEWNVKRKEYVQA